MCAFYILTLRKETVIYNSSYLKLMGASNRNILGIEWKFNMPVMYFDLPRID
jgi:hypothetical protein